MTTIEMNGVSATLTFQDLQDARWELVLSSGENYARIDGIIDDSMHSLKFNGEEAKLEFHKTDKVHWKLLFGVLEEGDLLNEFDLFNKIANEMDVTIAILCPHQSFKDYSAFKPDIADRTERIIDYFYADWHKDSVFAKQISWMKSACKKHSIEFERELMRDFFKYNESCTKSSINAFVKSLAKSGHDHREYIIKLIADCESTVGKNEKGEICIRIYEYLLHKALNYVKKTPKLKAVTIRKAYEFKKEEIPELTQSIDNFLTAIGEPLVRSVVPSVPSVPIVEYCPCCDSDDEYIDTWSQCIEDPYWGDNMKGGSCDQEKARSKLMQDLFKKEDLTFTIKVMPFYYEWAKTNEKNTNVNHYKKMCLFIEANRHALMEHDVCEVLMKSLFEKEKLVFTPDIMDVYYNSEVQTVRANRYKKMMLFINAYKNIDDETHYL